MNGSHIALLEELDAHVTSHSRRTLLAQLQGTHDLLEEWGNPPAVCNHAAYFDKFPGVWCHGDYVALTENGGMIVYGRSDAILNPGGVRIGTAEIYRPG